MRSDRRILAARVLIWVLVIGAWAGPAIGPARASCAGPAMFVEGHEGPAIIERIPAGSTVTIVGVRFAQGCNDVASPCTGGGFSDPIEDVEVQLIPAEWESRTRWFDTWHATGSPIALGTHDADDDFTVRIEDVTLPTTLGTYVIVTNEVLQQYRVTTPLVLV